ncbi:MAG: MFS transporter [Puniceicoccales bacterium]|jgi:MFS family permease|nr:MFS transporter [Puniceicoccales bacterium]
MALESPLDERAHRTFVYDNVRGIFTGVMECVVKMFAILIAIRVFHAPSLCKAALASAVSIGLLFAPLAVNLVSKFIRMPSTKICAFYAVFIACAFLVSAFARSFWSYFVPMIVAMVMFKQYIPLMIDVYGNNYNNRERGYKMSYSLMAAPIVTAIFSAIGGVILDSSLKNYRAILLTVAAAALGSAYAFLKIPSRPIPGQKGRSLLSDFKAIGKDRLFFSMLLLLTLTGVANQMTIPLRTEYLTNAEYGLDVSNLAVTLMVATIPCVSQMLSSVVWGKLFDRMPIIGIRVLVNAFLFVGFALFFNAKSFPELAVAAICMGLGYGGGEVVWRLWITRIVGKEKLSQYMSVDAAFVGMRSLISPFIGYFLLDHGFSFVCIGNISAVLVLCAMLGFFTLRAHPRFSKVYD